jgi:flagellar biosynthesis/type III secretory pathway M-ring protein FliF/YscJ
VSVNIDGTWERKQADKDADGGKTEREYKPVPPEQLEAARALIKGAIGFNEKRGDIVEVTNIQFDRSAQFEAEIEAAAASVEEQRRTRLTLTAACGLALLLALAFGLFQAGLKSKRLREAALAREHERLREEAERSVRAAAAENGLPISEEEKARNALAAKAADLVCENPLAAANLVKTWIAEG